MPDFRLKPASVIAAVLVPVGLVLLGAGCFDASKLAGQATDLAHQAGDAVGSAGNAVGDAMTQPAKVSVEALNKAKAVAAEEKRKQNENAEMVSDDMTVALVATESTVSPVGTMIDPDTFGCNDKIAFVQGRCAAATDNVVHDALMTMFSLKDSGTHAPLYNALAGSKLEVEKIQSADGVTTEIWLKGKVDLGGVCDGPRFKKQIESVVSRFRDSAKFKIFLNGTEANYRCVGDQTGECK